VVGDNPALRSAKDVRSYVGVRIAPRHGHEQAVKPWAGSSSKTSVRSCQLPEICLYWLRCEIGIGNQAIKLRPSLSCGEESATRQGEEVFRADRASAGSCGTLTGVMRAVFTVLLPLRKAVGSQDRFPSNHEIFQFCAQIWLE
jgi:hypothetical protein